MKLTDIPNSGQRLTLLCHKVDVDIVNDAPDTVTIDPEATMNMARSIDAEPGAWEYLKGNSGFMRLLRLVFTEKDFPTFPDHPLRLHGSGLRHTVGLIVLLRETMASGKRPFIRFPESYLHPAQQVGLGDLLVQLTAPGANHENQNI